MGKKKSTKTDSDTSLLALAEKKIRKMLDSDDDRQVLQAARVAIKFDELKASAAKVTYTPTALKIINLFLDIELSKGISGEKAVDLLTSYKDSFFKFIGDVHAKNREDRSNSYKELS